MKTIILTLLLSFVFSDSFAQENPQIRVCRTNNAYFWALNLEEPIKEEYGFCRYDNSLIGSLSLIDFFYHQKQSLAVQAYFNTREKTYNSCRQAGAIKVVGQEFPKPERLWLICSFQDNSLISLNTLVEGWHAQSNQRLTNALKANIRE